MKTGRGRSALLWFILLMVLMLGGVSAHAQHVQNVCPTNPVQPRPASFASGGLILTTFDRASLWILDVERGARYPLPGSRPCGPNCHLSPDALWFAYPVPPDDPPEDEVDSLKFPQPMFMKMRLDGSQATLIARDATDVFWWSDDTLIVWEGSNAYLQPDEALVPTETTPPERITLDARGVISVQPGGSWALISRYIGTQPTDEAFDRALVNLDIRALSPEAALSVSLGADVPYYNSAGWSPDGRWLAYVGALSVDDAPTAEIFTIQPGNSVPAQRTAFAEGGEPMRIGGQTAAGGLSWSPDSTRVAFWAMLRGENDPVNEAGEAVLHILDVISGEIRQYCGYSTPDHLPNPPRLVWSPDSTHVAFGGNLQDDERGVILLALNVEEGVFIELSAGLYPALGSADVIAWGLRP